ncbi:MAG: hypothetical protein AAGE98_09420 [Actinomycetota bacterium]
MRALVHVPDQSSHLLIATAADAVELDVALEFVHTPQALLHGLEASVATGWLPDVVIVQTDGTGSGLDALVTVKQDPIFWATPIMMLADNACDDERLRAYAAGAEWYQQMPHRFSDMKRLLKRLPKRLTPSASLDDRGIIEIAAADLIDEIEDWLIGQS